MTASVPPDGPFGFDATTLAATLGPLPFHWQVGTEDAARLRRLPGLAEAWRQIDDLAAAARREREPSLHREAWLAYARTGDRRPYEQQYFGRRHRLTALGLAAVVSRGAADGALCGLIEAVCDEPAWALPAHVPDPVELIDRTTVDLFAAETGAALAELGVLMGDRLPAGLRARIAAEVDERVLQQLLPGAPAFGWESLRNNWAAVCGGSALMAALYVEHDPARCAALVVRCLAALDVFLDGFASDGGCAEGVVYWAYGFGYFTYAADLLERATAGRVRIADDPRAVRAAAFARRVDLGPTRQLTYSDATDQRPNTAALAWWARRGVAAPAVNRLSVPSDDHCGRWAPMLRTMLWCDGLPSASVDHLDVFDDTGLAVVVRGPFAVAVKAGHNDEPHNHLDLGHVSVWLGDDQGIADIGAGPYSAAYFDPGTRYAQPAPSAAAHNAPLLDGAGQRQGPEARATLRVTGDERSGVAEVDLTVAYDGVTALVRTVAWSLAGPVGSVEITDRLLVDPPRPSPVVTQAWLSPVQPHLNRHGDAVEWELAAGTVRLSLPGPPAVDRLDSVDHRGRPVVWWRVAVTSRAWQSQHVSLVATIKP